MKDSNQRQPFYPWPGVLAQYGFSKSYILKDLFFKKEIEKLKLAPESKALDVGCGKGIFLSRLVKSFKVKGAGVDLSPKVIKIAKAKMEKCQLMVADATALPFLNKSFDAVFCLDTLEHVKKQNQALNEMVRVLKPKGFLYIYAMNKKRQLTFKWYLIHFAKLFKVDVYQKVGHLPCLFLEEKKINNFLKKNEIKILIAQPFHSFFTNLFDFVLLINYFLLSKLGFFRSEKLGKIVLTFVDFICRLAYYPLLIFDLPWRIAAQGNGLLIVGQKKCRNQNGVKYG